MKQLTFWDAPESTSDTDSVPTLIPLQQDLLDRGRQAFVKHRRVIWQAPCGAGKTWIAAEQTRLALARGNTVLHIVHRRRLVDQMVRTLSRFGVKASAIMEGRERKFSPVMCASRDTLLAMLKSGSDLPRASLIIPDECHVASTQVNQWYLDNCSNSFWCGYTATPVRPNGSSLSPPYEALVCMAPASKLIEIGRLCPVKVFNPDAIGQRRRKGERVKPVGDPIDHWRKYAEGLPTVVFAANVAQSLEICSRYNRAGIPAEHLDASTPEDVREAIFERSRLGITLVICNCGVMIEGIDLPWLTCCQILRGCNSLVLWVQATGRVMRFLQGKSHGIVLDHAGAAHEFGLPDSDYQWSLEDGAANERRNKPDGDRKPVTCLGCGAVFAGKAACPECGKVLHRKKRKSVLDGLDGDDGLLTEFTEGQRAAMRQDALERLWKNLLYKVRAGNGTMGQVAARFSKDAKIPPWEAGLDVPMPGRGNWNIPVSEWLEANR